MTDFYLRSGGAAERLNSTAYTLGQRVVIARTDAQSNFAVMRRYVYECTVAGTSHTSAPIYPVTPDSGTVSEGVSTPQLQWTCRECNSWANSARYADYVSTRLAAGDRLFVSQAHAESHPAATNITINFTNGTIANPCWFICVNDAVEPPTASATGASITTTTTGAITITGAVTAYGIAFNAFTSTSGGTLQINTGIHIQRYISCDIFQNSTGGSQQIRIGYGGGGAISSETIFENCRFKVMNVGSRILCGGYVRFTDISWASGSSTPTGIFSGVSGSPVDVLVENSDFTNLTTTTVNLLVGGSYSSQSGRFMFRNIRMIAGWSGGLVGASITTLAMRAEMHNVDAGDTGYTIRAADYAGSLTQETGFVRTGGASDGVTTLAWKMTTTANCALQGARFISPEIHRRVTAIGSPVTVTVEILHDSTTNLKNDEVWLDVKYLNESGFTTGASSRDVKTDLIATGVDQTGSGATWTTTGLTNPNKQKLEATFTPQEAGYIIAKVCMGKAGPYTIYVDPKLTVA
jgi:hypothetical protein